MLVLGRAGSAGCEKGVSPVLRDDVVVGTVRASNWKEAATAVVENREWVLARTGRELTGRAAHDPEGTARLRARQTSWWTGIWTVDLEGTRIQVEPASRWRGMHRYLVEGRVAAESGSTGGWWPRPTLQADGALPLDQQVFLLWLGLVIRGRDSSVLGAGDGGGAEGGGGGD